MPSNVIHVLVLVCLSTLCICVLALCLQGMYFLVRHAIWRAADSTEVVTSNALVDGLLKVRHIRAHLLHGTEGL
jgi:hypothetical protein